MKNLKMYCASPSRALRLSAAVCGFVALLTGCRGGPQSTFRPGQVWEFNTPVDQPEARILVLLVEDGGTHGVIVHVTVERVHYGSGFDSIGHMPFAQSALADSVTRLVETRSAPPVHDGYLIWKEEFDQGRAGVFAISVSDAITFVLSQVPKSP